MPANAMIRVTHYKVILSDENCLVAQYLIQIKRNILGFKSPLTYDHQREPLNIHVGDAKQWHMFFQSFIVYKGQRTRENKSSMVDMVTYDVVMVEYVVRE